MIDITKDVWKKRTPNSYVTYSKYISNEEKLEKQLLKCQVEGEEIYPGKIVSLVDYYTGELVPFKISALDYKGGELTIYTGSDPEVPTQVGIVMGHAHIKSSMLIDILSSDYYYGSYLGIDEPPLNKFMMYVHENIFEEFPHLAEDLLKVPTLEEIKFMDNAHRMIIFNNDQSLLHKSLIKTLVSGDFSKIPPKVVKEMKSRFNFSHIKPQLSKLLQITSANKQEQEEKFGASGINIGDRTEQCLFKFEYTCND